MKHYLRQLIKRLPLIPVLSILLTGCTFATIRPIAEDTAAKQGFNAVAYVDGIWDSKIIPTVKKDAVDFQTLIAEIDKDKDTAIKKYGKRSGTGSYSFMVKGEAKIVNIDTASRAGIINIELPPYDGTAKFKMALGPVITGNAVRDAVGFIQFNDFTNQLDFADVSKELNKRVAANAAKSVNASTAGKTVNYYGAFTLDDRNKIVITPLIIEVK